MVLRCFLVPAAAIQSLLDGLIGLHYLAFLGWWLRILR